MKFEYTIEPGSTRSQWKVLENGDMIAICQNEPNALTMIGILNEHDTLKTKENLLNEMGTCLSNLLREIQDGGSVNKRYAYSLLSKTKDLK